MKKIYIMPKFSIVESVEILANPSSGSTDIKTEGGGEIKNGGGATEKEGDAKSSSYSIWDDEEE